MSTSPPRLYGNPEAFAKKYPHPWEAEEFGKGKYPRGAAWTPGHLNPDWRPPTTTISPKAPPPMPKLLQPLRKERRITRQKALSWLHLWWLCRLSFLRNLALLSPKPCANSWPPQAPLNPTHKHSKWLPISQTSLPLFSEKPTAPFPVPSLAQSTTRVQCHC